MSKLDRRIESLGKRLGAFAATAKFRVTEWGPVREIHLRERVGGKFIWRLTEATRAIRKRLTEASKVRHLYKLKEQKRLLEKIMHYVFTKYGKTPEIVQTANDIYKKGGTDLLLAVLEGVNKDALVVGSQEFDAGLFDLVSQTGDEVVVADQTFRREWVSVTSGEPVD